MHALASLCSHFLLECADCLPDRGVAGASAAKDVDNADSSESDAVLQEFDVSSRKAAPRSARAVENRSTCGRASAVEAGVTRDSTRCLVTCRELVTLVTLTRDRVYRCCSPTAGRPQPFAPCRGKERTKQASLPHRQKEKGGKMPAGRIDADCMQDAQARQKCMKTESTGRIGMLP